VVNKNRTRNPYNTILSAFIITSIFTINATKLLQIETGIKGKTERVD